MKRRIRMKSFFARLFGPQYHHEVVLSNGQHVVMTSRNPFTTEDVANHFRPAPRKGAKFLKALPWIIIGLLVISLGICNWLWYENRLDLYDAWQSDLDNYSTDYNALNKNFNDYRSKAQESIDYYENEAQQCQADNQELGDQLNGLYTNLDQLDYDASNIESDLYSMWYDKYYNNTSPTVADLDTIKSDASNLDDSIHQAITDLANYLNNR
jgi:hypothetical protein